MISDLCLKTGEPISSRANLIELYLQIKSMFDAAIELTQVSYLDPIKFNLAPSPLINCNVSLILIQFCSSFNSIPEFYE
jgi:hypothetical protein